MAGPPAAAALTVYSQSGLKAGTSMNVIDFEKLLKAEGYKEIETKQLSAGTHNAAHDHPFDVRALVLGGEITLTVEGSARAYREGEVFTMAAGCRHVEDIGPDGVRYLVGRRRAQG